MSNIASQTVGLGIRRMRPIRQMGRMGFINLR
jgi:hypothetical protein